MTRKVTKRMSPDPMVDKNRLGVENAQPNSYNLIAQIRNITYSFESAISDLIDNCIDAGASQIWIAITPHGLQIADNGKGMSDLEHADSMVLAMDKKLRSPDDLGKFGLGMKLASLSQADSMTVLTKQLDSMRVSARRIDMDFVEKAGGSWDIVEIVDPESCSLARPLGHSGTVVILENLSRFIKRATGKDGGTLPPTIIEKYADDLDAYISRTFHRFLEGKVSGREPVSIYINGLRVRPWDPFILSEDTWVLEPKRYLIDSHSVTVQPFVLPTESEFTNREAFQLAGGQKRWLDSQGFYVYRNNRLISAGGWLRVRGIDEKLKGARIALEVPPALDQDFNIDISKGHVELPLSLRNVMKKDIEGVTARANARYRHGDERSVKVSRLQKEIRDKKLTELEAFEFTLWITQAASELGLDAQWSSIKAKLAEDHPEAAKLAGWL